MFVNWLPGRYVNLCIFKGLIINGQAQYLCWVLIEIQGKNICTGTQHQLSVKEVKCAEFIM